MKRACVSAIMGIVLAAGSMAQQPVLNLTWQASPSPGVVYYRIYVGPTNGIYTTNYTVQGTQTTLSNLVDGAKYHIIGTAVNVYGRESEPSKELVWSMPDRPVWVGEITAELKVTGQIIFNFKPGQ